MKKMLKYTSLSAIAFVGAVSFSACSSSDDMTESPNNPNYNPETNKVKTEFVINVTQPGERTRMTAANAGAGTFQGLKNMQLICFTDVPGTDNEFAAADKLTLTPYDGPTLSGDNTTGSSKVYTLYIPTGTSNFLFYATTWPSVGASNKFDYGSLQNNLGEANGVVTTSTPAATGISFTLDPIASSLDVVSGCQEKLKGILNDIKNAQITIGSDPKTWASTSAETATQWIALGDAFDAFTNQVQSGSYDVRQGSSTAILNMVSDLFNAVIPIYVNESDVNAKALAKAILEKIYSHFSVTRSGTDPDYTYSWGSATYKTTSGDPDGFTNFPESKNLPTGSAVIVYNSTDSPNEFSYVNDGHMGTAAVSTAYNKFTYPSELTYYCNSGLWQSATGKNTTDYPTTSTDWITAASWSGWSNTPVTAATRAVAMKDNITYGAAQLYSTIKLGEGVGSTTDGKLVDNASTLTNGAVADNVFDGTDGKTIVLKVHGILIGGQPAASMYDYLPLNNDASDVIYDKFSAAGTTVTEGGVTNYTLAMDNFTSAETQNPVNVALEMTANKDFYGVSGKIKAGQKFYLIGSLDPNESGLTAVDWTTHKSFKSGDRGQGVDRVFIRDAKTIANFTLQKNTLKNAYSTIPDLRSTQMLFGISVDLAWKAGLTFNVPIGN